MLVIYFNYYYHLHVILIIIVYMEQRSPNCNPPGHILPPPIFFLWIKFYLNTATHLFVYFLWLLLKHNSMLEELPDSVTIKAINIGSLALDTKQHVFKDRNCMRRSAKHQGKTQSTDYLLSIKSRKFDSDHIRNVSSTWSWIRV